MEEIFELQLSMPYITMSNFKRKNLLILLECIGRSRLRDFMQLYSYGEVEYNKNDKQLVNPIVHVNHEYNRLKTNCLVFALPRNEYNKGYYDKLFVYYSQNRQNPFYGFVLYNSLSKKSSHVYFLEYDDNNLLHQLNHTFNCMDSYEVFDFYKKKYEGALRKNNKTIDDAPTVKDYRELFE